jgi:ABC-2 type transport system permease protein
MSSPAVSRILAVMKKELAEARHDPYFLSLAFVLPVLLLFIFSYAFTFDVEEIPTAVYDRDRTPTSRDYLSHFVDSRYFHLKTYLQDDREITRLLEHGRVRVVLVIPEDFSRQIARGRRAKVQALVDGTYAITARAVTNYVRAINAAYSSRVTARFAMSQSEGALPSSPSIEPVWRVWFNPTLETEHYVVSGMFIIILLAFPPMLTALAVVREKESGSIQQVFVSPIRSYQFLLGKMIPYVVLTFFDLLMIVVAALYWFKLPLRGSLSLFLAASVIYVFCTVGIGLLCSILARTQLAAMLLSLMLGMFPSFYFSGFLYPIDKIPASVQGNTYLFPGRYFNDIARGIFLRGSGLQHLWEDILSLSLYTTLIFAICWVRFKKRL